MWLVGQSLLFLDSTANRAFPSSQKVLVDRAGTLAVSFIMRRMTCVYGGVRVGQSKEGPKKLNKGNRAGSYMRQERRGKVQRMESV